MDPIHNPGGIVEESAEDTKDREAADAARRPAHDAHVPPELWPFIDAFVGAWRTRQPVAVQSGRAIALAGVLEDMSPARRWDLVARTLHIVAAALTRGR